MLIVDSHNEGETYPSHSRRGGLILDQGLYRNGSPRSSKLNIKIFIVLVVLETLCGKKPWLVLYLTEPKQKTLGMPSPVLIYFDCGGGVIGVWHGAQIGVAATTGLHIVKIGNWHP